MLSLREFRRPKKLSHRLPWGMFVDEGVILNKVGAFQKTYEFRGPDVYSSTDEERDSLCAQVNNNLKRIGTGWAVFCEPQRRATNEYPQSSWPTYAAQLIDHERYRQFAGEGDHYVSRFFITFTYLPPHENINRVASLFYEKKGKKNKKGEEEINYQKYLDYFNSEMKKFGDTFKNVFAYCVPLNDDDTLTYLHSCVSTKNHIMKSPGVPVFLDYMICDEIFSGGLEPMLGENHLGVITITGFPFESYPQIIGDLNNLPFEYRWQNRFICIDRADAIQEIHTYTQKWFNKRKKITTLIREAIFQEETEIAIDKDAESKAEECGELGEIVASGISSAGYYTSTLVIWNTDPEKLKDNLLAVSQVINANGFSCITETFNAVQAWFGSLPGHCWANIRRPLITAMNYSHLIPVAHEWDGPNRCKHLKGPPLFYARTETGTPFRFSNYVGDVGHCFLCGPTGAGKSVFLGFMAASFLRYPNAQVVMFDKDFAALGLTLAMGGKHYDLGEDKKLSFQPLKEIDDDGSRQWAAEWLHDFLHKEGVKVSPVTKNELWSALNNLASAPCEQRTITGLSALVQSHEIRDALESITIEGAYGYLLDSDEDFLTNRFWQTFEMGYLMEYAKSAVVPVLTYIFHALEKNFDGRPTMLILDESWRFLDDPIFEKKIREWLKTLRKKNVSVIFATQQVADIGDSAIVHTLIDSCSSRVYLPNPKAMEPKMAKQYKEFGLNDRQVEILANSISKKDYYLQTHVGNRKFDLDLGPATLALVGSSTKSDIKKIRHAQNEAKGDATEFVKKFLELKGVYHERN